MTEAERQIYQLWGKWQGIDDISELVTVNRIKKFSVDALQVELKSMIDSANSVMSNYFKNKMQRKIARHTFPELSNADLEIIKKEIDDCLNKQEYGNGVNNDNKETNKETNKEINKEINKDKESAKE